MKDITVDEMFALERNSFENVLFSLFVLIKLFYWREGDKE